MKRYVDRRLVKKYRRICDDERIGALEKAKSMIVKAVVWCKQKIDQFPVLKKVVRILLKMRSSLDAIEAGASFGAAGALKLKSVAEMNDNLMSTFGIKFSSLGLFLHGIKAALKSAIAWQVANRAFGEAENEEKR